jgi:hypothetical protein
LDPNLIGCVDRARIWDRSRKAEILSEEEGILFLRGVECFSWNLDAFHEEYLDFFYYQMLLLFLKNVYIFPVISLALFTDGKWESV